MISVAERLPLLALDVVIPGLIPDGNVGNELQYKIGSGLGGPLCASS